MSRDRLLQDWDGAQARAVAYLEALGVAPQQRAVLAAEAIERAASSSLWPPGATAFDQTGRALRHLLTRADPSSGGAAEDAFLAWRLEAALAGHLPPRAPSDALPSGMLSRPGVLCSTPPLERRPMVPNRFFRLRLRRGIIPIRRGAGTSGEPTPAPAWFAPKARRQALAWTRTAHRRRTLLAVLVLIPTVVASGFMLQVLPQQGKTLLEMAISLCFGALFGWISIGFWTALLGFLLLTGRKDRFAITAMGEADNEAFAPEGRTAIVMPICEEPVDRVFAGLKVIYDSLVRAGSLEHFDIFILSDTIDPALWVREEAAWFEWCREVKGFGRIFYRRRHVRIERKSGNVADFCRRWGGRYRYMIMLDADSVMTGKTLVRLVRMMERHAGVGMIQTVPFAVNRRSLFARIQQFAARLYGPMFAAGLHYWQLGDGQYWGHNAIIRVEPFMEHCALPRLPGEPPFGGEILSHDFVEAALMGRAGWELWLAFDLGGSYEETPPSLLEEMKRDRRWCQGNLQHLRLLFTEGFFGAHRALFLNGVLSYVSALLWFLFLSLSTAEAVWEAVRPHDYFPGGRSLFPEWPVWRPDWALALFAVTAAILFLPKILSAMLVLFKWRNARTFGGAGKMALSVVLEILASALFAPIRMVFHTRFVLTNLVGRTVSWHSQTREDAETHWGEAIRYHGLDTVVASAWGFGVHWLSPQYFWWLTPIVVALILSVPLSVYASRVRIGLRARRLGLFLIPEETQPPPEIDALERGVAAGRDALAALPPLEADCFVPAAVDPYANAIQCALRGAPRSFKPSILKTRAALLERTLRDGPAALSARERRILLSDSRLAGELHRGIWDLADPASARQWGRPGEQH